MGRGSPSEESRHVAHVGHRGGGARRARRADGGDGDGMIRPDDLVLGGKWLRPVATGIADVHPAVAVLPCNIPITSVRTSR